VEIEEEQKSGDGKYMEFKLDIRGFAKEFIGYIEDVFKDGDKLHKLGFSQDLIELVEDSPKGMKYIFDTADSQLYPFIDDAIGDGYIKDTIDISLTVGDSGVLKELSMLTEINGEDAGFSMFIEKTGDSSLDVDKIKEEIEKAKEEMGAAKD
jgi:hypothetical protein